MLLEVLKLDTISKLKMTISNASLRCGGDFTSLEGSHSEQSQSLSHNVDFLLHSKFEPNVRFLVEHPQHSLPSATKLVERTKSFLLETF